MATSAICHENVGDGLLVNGSCLSCIYDPGYTAEERDKLPKFTKNEVNTPANAVGFP